MKMAEISYIVDIYINHLDNCLITDPNIGYGWYRDLKKSDRVGTVATAQIALSFLAADKILPHRDEILQTLLSRKLADGSWAYISNIDQIGVVDATAWALQALHSLYNIKMSGSLVLEPSYEWLLKNQNPDGGWGLTKASKSRAVSTCIALDALIVADNENYSEYIKKGIKYLIDTQNQNGSWSSASQPSCIGSTAHALISLASVNASNTKLTIIRGKNFLLEAVSREDRSLWDSYVDHEEIEVKVNNGFVRTNYYYSVTPLSIRALKSVCKADEIEKILEIYFDRLANNDSFRGTRTISGNDTSYGFHDIIQSILGNTNNLTAQGKKSSTSHSTLEDIIDPKDFPRLYKINTNITHQFHNINIIFIHGLGGHPLTTWINKESGFFLPDIFNEPSYQFNTYTLGYQNSSSYWSGTAMSLQDRSVNIIQLLSFSELEGDIVFVGHSFGGLLIKSILCEIHSFGFSDPQKLKILNNTKGVCFLATPHQGSSLANFAKSLGILYKATVSINDLQWKNPELKKINDHFKNIAMHNDIKLMSFSETMKTSGVSVVNHESADLIYPGHRAIPIDADHITITKPRDSKALVPQSILKFVKDIQGNDT